jgi:heat shock protein HslJ
MQATQYGRSPSFLLTLNCAGCSSNGLQSTQVTGEIPVNSRIRPRHLLLPAILLVMIIFVWVGSVLLGTRWQLISINGSTPIKESDLSVQFSMTILGPWIEGSSGCNSFNGRYFQFGHRIILTSINVTQRLCHEPDGVMTQEEQYLGLLAQIERYKIEDDNLILMTSTNQSLVYRRVMP